MNVLDMYIIMGKKEHSMKIQSNFDSK